MCVLCVCVCVCVCVSVLCVCNMCNVLWARARRAEPQVAMGLLLFAAGVARDIITEAAEGAGGGGAAADDYYDRALHVFGDAFRVVRRARACACAVVRPPRPHVARGAGAFARAQQEGGAGAADPIDALAALRPAVLPADRYSRLAAFLELMQPGRGRRCWQLAPGSPPGSSVVCVVGTLGLYLYGARTYVCVCVRVCVCVCVCSLCACFLLREILD